MSLDEKRPVSESLDSLKEAENALYIKNKMFSEQLKILNKNLLYSVPANFICATVVLIGMDQASNSFLVYLWYAIVALISIFRIGSYYLYQKRPQSKLNLPIFMIGASLSALLWGFADSDLIPKDNIFEQMIIIVVVAGITAGSIQTLQANLLASFLYISFIIAPLSAWLFLQHGITYFVLGLAMSAYLFFMYISIWRGHQLLNQALRLQFENMDLIDHLSHSNVELMNVNRANIELVETLHEQAIRDSLTGLYNRRYLDEILNREMLSLKRNQSVMSVCMIDIDFFKQLNDQYGHEAGDEVLKFIGMKLRQDFRGNDIAFRFGGEEFVLILMKADMKAAIQKLKQLSAEIKASQVYFQGHCLPAITISVGIAEAPRQSSESEEILFFADRALYTAKQTGRDRVVGYVIS